MPSRVTAPGVQILLVARADAAFRKRAPQNHGKCDPNNRPRLTISRASGIWTRGRTKGAHSGHAAILLNDDTILVAGGSLKRRNSSEVGALTAP